MAIDFTAAFSVPQYEIPVEAYSAAFHHGRPGPIWAIMLYEEGGKIFQIYIRKGTGNYTVGCGW